VTELVRADRPQSKQFQSFVGECLQAGLRVRFQARGPSMSPAVRDGEVVYVKPVSLPDLRTGDIVLTRSDHGFRLHRLVYVDAAGNIFITRGDCGLQDDAPVSGDQILGIAVAKEVRIAGRNVRASLYGFGGRLANFVARSQSALTKKFAELSAMAGVTGRQVPLYFALSALLVFLLTPASSSAQQVAVDSTSSTSADLTGPGTQTLTFAHTTTMTVNRLLLVGVSMNIANSTSAAVSGITYGGTALTFVGAQNDAAPSRRVELWSLIAPANGTANIVVSINIPATATVGVVAGATTFTDVDQNVPLGPLASASGESSGCVATSAAGNYQCTSGTNVTSVVNGLVFDALAVGEGTISVESPQVQQWNASSGGANPDAAEDIIGTSSTRSGAPAVPVAENFNNALTLTSVANAAGGHTVYTGTITGGANNGYVGQSFVVAGFTKTADNGTFTCTASTATTLTLNNTAGSAQTHAGTATTNGTFNWSQAAISVNPVVADIGVTTTVSTVMVGQPTTYNITIFNNGTSPATGVSLSDTLASGMILGPVTPSSGVTCNTSANPITCAIGNLASGAKATVSVVETASAAGSYANTASVNDTGPTDPNTGNNSFTAVATVQSATCANVTQASPASSPLTGVLNTYYPGTASVTAGTASITLGAATGGPGGTPTAIAAGNLLLVIQMQDASISTSNSVDYGNNSTGAGFTSLNNAGNYEFVTATNAVNTGGGTLTIAGSGTGGGLVFSYDSSAETATKGQSTFQVILVPQYTTATLAATGLTAPAWNGSTGGVLALDTSSTLTLNGATVVVDGLGFRGGAGLELGGGGGSASDFVGPAPATYTPAGAPPPDTTTQVGWHAAKGEGIAGTPFWVQSGGTFLATGTGYPSGTAGTDGSMARGAPGNAGGGGTDADPQPSPPAGNDQNTGGGGGGNGGAGGFGGDSWSTNLSTGGEGGAAFPATVDRVAMGGGGGAGTRNNSNTDNQASGGSAGGGIIVIRAYALAGTATLTANGANAYNDTANDGGGGAGAGGSIVVLSANGGESGLTLQANGGVGGDAWGVEPFTLGNRHGPGGGGGGGVLIVSGTPASTSVNGGANGTTETPGVPYGSTPGAAGIVMSNATITQTSGTESGAECTPDMTIGKSHVGNFTRGSTASYTVPVSNISPFGPSVGAVNMNDTLPTGLTPTGAAGTGWSCSVASQTASCVRGDSLAGNSSYPSITITANVAQTAPSTVTNTALVSGGGEINLSNDSATDVANVVSSADLSVANAASPNPVAAAANISYTQVVTNNGPSAADDATLVEAVPANTTFLSIAAPSGWSCVTPGVGGTGNIVCSIVSLNGGSSANFSVVVKVNAGVANGTLISDTVTASSSTSDPNSANNSATAVTVVGATTLAELTVTNSASPNPVQAGNNITYTQVVTNTGSATATGATFSEPTPGNTALSSLTAAPGWSCSTPPAPVSCTNSGVTAGSSGTFTVVYTVAGTTPSGTVITDTATANATNQAFGSSSAVATDVVATAGQADLALTTAATPPTVIAGNNITYTQTVTNNGPATASSVSFTEAIPANTTYVSVSAPAGWTCTVTSSVTCTISSLASGATADIIVVVNLAPTVSVATVTATSSVGPTTNDPNTANNSTTVTTNVRDACDLTVTNTGSPVPVAAGGTLTYTQTVTNGGPSNCSTATFSEATPANTTFSSVSVVNSNGGTWTCPNAAPVSCTSSSVAPGSLGTITAKYIVSGTASAGTIISDTVTAASATHDTNPADNSATSNIAVAGSGQADLSVTNSGSPNPVTAGNTVTFTQVVTNGGPASASTITLTETIPTNTTVSGLSGPAGWTCVTGASPNCTIGTMANNTTATFSYTLKVSSGVAIGSTITETANVSSSVTSDPNPNNNTAPASVQVGNSADLSITNSANPVPVIANNNITYTQGVSSAGPSAATGVTVTESVPANTTAQTLSGPAGWVCNVGTLTCTDSSLAALANANISFVVQVNSGTASGTAVNDTVTVTSSVPDPNPANNTATANDVVASGSQSDLIVTNSASPTTVAAGSNVTYTQTVTNNGPAAASTVSFTQTTPPNTNFQSITPPAGWLCGTQPAVGGTGTITCTESNLALNGSATFTLVLQVNTGTPSGTYIGEPATATASNVVPNLTSNTATATVLVANANSADMAIAKAATPSPTVPDGDILTYTLTVTNNGPASATDVTVTDPLPDSVTYLSSSSSQGTCSEAGGTVTCLLGTMAVSPPTATVTIVTLAGAPGFAANTASVTADQTDPNTSNNSSTQNETITAPTRVQLMSFSAQTSKDKNGAGRVILFWRTGGEAHNLGFNVYREQNGSRVRLNPSLIAGSALLMRGALPKHSGKTYSWIDSSPTAGTGQYWLEDVDVNGTRTMHGPVEADVTVQVSNDAAPASTLMLDQLNQALPGIASDVSHPLEYIPHTVEPTPTRQQKQYALAASHAVKIMVKHEAWYCLSQPELVKAGLNPNVDPTLLHLYAEANEQPVAITGALAGPGGFGSQGSMCFYGTGIDTPYSGTRVYWLDAEDSPGVRIQQLPESSGSNQPPVSFAYTVEWKPRTTYFAALITQNGNNFFGPLISSTPLDQVIEIPHIDKTSADKPALEITLQGIILGVPHSVAVALNGTTVGTVTFTGQDQGRLSVNLPPGLLVGGSNTLTLTAEGGAYDTSLVDDVRICYSHRYVADSNLLKFTGRAGDELQITGFDSAPAAVLDITNPEQPVQLTPQIVLNSGKYAASIQVPWSSTGATSSTQHTLLALASDRLALPAGLRSNHPSHWHGVQPGSPIVMVTYEDFAAALPPLVQAHQAEGQSSAVVLVGDLYDEFTFGEHSPYAIREFLQTASKVWHTAPKYLLLNGRASLDPRNFLGFGHLDLVPTKIVPTSSLMTASDDWFSDFNNSGTATIATGRLPVATADEANAVIDKISGYESQATNGPWTLQALMVADQNDTEDFSADSQTVQARLPAAVQATDVFASAIAADQARQDIVNAINSGQLLVNYLGHGSEEEWSGENLFDSGAVTSLTNGAQLPVFLIMNCLNGFFQDVYEQPLAVTLELAPQSGAVAVLASSGLNQPQPQVLLDQLIVQDAFGSPQPALGTAILHAKTQISDPSVRATYILFGDPAMTIKAPSTKGAGKATH
jgi:uncharacterized repeat protein (TIGR01451 family)